MFAFPPRTGSGTGMGVNVRDTTGITYNRPGVGNSPRH
jgi:hypothetical protein